MMEDKTDYENNIETENIEAEASDPGSQEYENDVEKELHSLKSENRRLKNQQKRYISFWKKSVSVFLAVSLVLLTVCVVQTCRVSSVTRKLQQYSTDTTAETEITDTEMPLETALSETVPPETAAPETAPPETAPPETAPPETAPPETAPPETPAQTASAAAAVPEPAPAKMVYLTFDDGPSQYTDYILDTLAQYGVKATFFVILRNDEDSIAKYRRIVNEGHLLAMHSVSHNYDTIYANIEAYAADVQGLRDFLTQVTGFTPWLYRFPGGSRSVKFGGRMPVEECINWLNAAGITYVDWNVSSGDASSTPISAEQITANIMDSQYSVVRMSTPVVLMHDSAGKAETMNALPGIIERILALGYQIGPITPETPLVHQNLN